MTWAAAAVLLAVVLVVVAVALRRTIRSLQWVADDLQREAGPLLAELEGEDGRNLCFVDAGDEVDDCR